MADYANKLASSKGLDFVRIARRKILKYQIIEINGERLFITGIKEVRNATQIAFEHNETALIKRIVNRENIEAEKLKELFRSIVRIIPIIAPSLSRSLSLEEKTEQFDACEKEEQGSVLLQIISNINGHRNMIDITAIGGPSHAGCLQRDFRKIINSDSSFSIIDQSITGMFERRTHLGL